MRHSTRLQRIVYVRFCGGRNPSPFFIFITFHIELYGGTKILLPYQPEFAGTKFLVSFFVLGALLPDAESF